LLQHSALPSIGGKAIVDEKVKGGFMTPSQVCVLPVSMPALGQGLGCSAWVREGGSRIKEVMLSMKGRV